MASFLVVDDEPNTSLALGKLLQGDGHEVAAVTSGEEALALLGERAFDVVVTDYSMPGVSGDEVARKAREHHPCACIFVHSGHEGLGDLEGACGVFDKPIDYDDLQRIVGACRRPGGPGQQGDCELGRARRRERG